ncbi:MAG: ATP-binding cassette domain-containing protein [Clostridia bacterium]|nr:ATP-binding cassette domain-containing protein [Clostridia bacterium]
MEEKIALRLENLSKHFGSIQANKNVSMSLRRGEILAVLGENGSGKTTLMNMISGIYAPDSGHIYIDGEEAVIHSPQDAFKYKIGMIHQHFKLINVFSASQNIILGLEENTLNMKKINLKVKSIADKYGFNIEPTKKIYDMSVSEKQTVEIIKVLYRGAEILILDEPTAVLTPQEIEKLFAVLRKMKEDGKSIIIITHKLNEVMSISDEVAVMRKGEYIGTVKTSETTVSELTEMMVGRKVELNIMRSEPKDPDDRLVIKNLSYKNKSGVEVLHDVSFTARGGEILGIAGIAGSGQKELLESIAGLRNLSEGEIIFHNPKKNKPVTFFHKSLKRVKELANAGAFHYEDGTVVDFSGMPDSKIKELVNEGKILFNEDEIINLRDKTPLEIRELGVRLSFVPEDRLGMGLVGKMDIVDNMMLRSYRKGNGIFLDRKKPSHLADKIIEDLEVVTPNSHTAVRKLSGGNVQKVLVGREISSAPKVLMVAYPVRGLDVNSSYLIYNLLDEQKRNGSAIIFVGEDLDVLIGLCDRIAVMTAGRITGIVDGRTAKKEEIGVLMTKVHDDETEAAND